MQKLSEIAPRFIIGGSGWSDQLVHDPHSLPVLETILHAMDVGIRAFDTSPYYGPSEVLLGRAFSHATFRAKYNRDDYLIMTKCGRIKADEFDYSGAWIKKSVERSLERFNIDYLDVVFCHDVEYVREEEVMEAVGVLFDLQRQGKVKYVGISGYPPAVLGELAHKIRQKFGRPVDAVQTYCHFTILNTTLYTKHLPLFKEAGVDCVFNASPLAMGLLRADGVPIGDLGDWHPAPPDLRRAAKAAADYAESIGDNLASIALRYAVGKAVEMDTLSGGGHTITGAGTIQQIDENLNAVKRVLSSDNKHGDARDLKQANVEALEKDEEVFRKVREILGDWIDYSWDSPGQDWLDKRAQIGEEKTKA